MPADEIHYYYSNVQYLSIECMTTEENNKIKFYNTVLPNVIADDESPSISVYFINITIHTFVFTFQFLTLLIHHQTDFPKSRIKYK